MRALRGSLRTAVAAASAARFPPAPVSLVGRSLSALKRQAGGGVSAVACSQCAHAFSTSAAQPRRRARALPWPGAGPLGPAGYPGRSATRSLFTSVLTHYVDIPGSYEDEVGLPFRRRGDLDRDEVAAVFGAGMNPARANRLLRILHGRRVAGTLDDPEFRVNTASFTQAEIDAGLAYLRKTTPVDEVINAGLRAEDELAALERDVLAAEAAEEAASATDAAQSPEEREALEKDALAKGVLAKGGAGTALVASEAQPPSTESKWRARLFREAPDSDVYGAGAFDAIRARNQAKNAERERLRQQLEAERRAQEEQWAAEHGGPRALEAADAQAAEARNRTALARLMAPHMKRWEERATSPLREPPTMTRGERLWPSTLFAAALLAAGGVWASVYEPPAEDRRLMPQVSASTATMGVLVAANVAVWLFWKWPPAWRLFNRYALLVPATPRPASLVGAMFSHQTLGHLAANVAFLWFIGGRLHDEVGRAAFLEVYFASGMLAFLSSLANIVLRNNLHLTTLGASGAIYGIATAYFMLHKFDGFKIFGLPPDPYTGVQGLGFIGLMLGLNMLALRGRAGGNVDVITHFVGMAVGAAAGEYFARRRAEDQRAAAECRPPRGNWTLLMAVGENDAGSPEKRGQVRFG